MTAAQRPIVGPGLRASLLNAALRRCVKYPALRGANRELDAAVLREGARLAAQAMWHHARVPPFITIEPTRIATPGFDMSAEWISSSRTRDGSNEGHVILYFHGGGYFMCSAVTHRPVTSRLAHGAGRRVLAINYRQGPKHTFPAWLDDAMSAYRTLLDQGFRPEHIALGGDSAGGNLTLVTLQQLRTEKLPMPGAAFCISPWTCMAGESESLERNQHRDPMFTAQGVRAISRYHSRGHDPKHPLLSPAYADYTGFPPLLIQVSSTEVLRDDGRRAAQRAREAGVPVTLEEWHGLPHVFHIFAGYIPEAGKALRSISEFVRQNA